ncbi:hypothetical protein RIR_jg6887.t1 [Rhizophagus irregularis DAOM 181602=DAOM 197198]|nr:hypothetical protein RIR_jg6887.t1 [Rhizophagus irregularis DAOM 181602=DAOM 197198]
MIGWSISSNLKIIFFSHLEVLLRILDIFKSVVKVLTVIIQYNSQNFILRLQDFVLHLEARLPFFDSGVVDGDGGDIGSGMYTNSSNGDSSRRQRMIG